MSDHAERLRHMAEGWLQSARDEEKFSAGLNLHSGAMMAMRQNVAHYNELAAALLAGAEALERLDAMESTSSAMLPKSASVSEVEND